MRRAWDAGQKVEKFIGFDATEDHRTFADGSGLKIAPMKGVPAYGQRYDIRYPLREWGLDRAAIGRLIVSEGLPLPPKSACFFCPAMKKIEILQLQAEEPELYAMALEMERLFRSSDSFRGDNVWTVKGKHKVTKELVEAEIVGDTKEAVRLAFRTQINDTGRPYQWDLSLSPAVPGLGRSFTWESVA